MLATMPSIPACAPLKRPRGIWKARTAQAKPPAPALLFSQAVFGPLRLAPAHDSDTDDARNSYDDEYDDDEDEDDVRSWTSGSSKRRRCSGLFEGAVSPCRDPEPRPRPASTDDNNGVHSGRASPEIMSIPSSSTAVESVRAPGDFEAWERLKDDFAKAAEQYETDDIAATLPMLRQVLSECHRFLIQYDDPSVLFVSETTDVEPSPQLFTPSEERLARDWGFNNDEDGFFARPIISYRREPRGELTTAFHAILGITLFLFGNLVAQDSSLVLKNEPSNATDYWLAALDVFETGENLPSRTAGRSEAEDWRMAIVWGRTLVCLADEKISRSRQARKEAEEAGTEYSSFMSYDAFMAEEPKWPADSIFHAIAQRRPPVTRRMSLTYASANDVLTLAMDQFSRGIFHMPHAQSSHSHHFHCSSSSTHNPESSSFSRPKELFTIASEVLGVAERLEAAPERQYWASWADSVFNQMKMEVDMDAWRGPITSARGRCWLIMGSAKVEELESALERGDEAVLRSEDAEEAREGLAMAISFFERAKGSRTSTMLSEEDEDLQSLLAEALLTLANLTIDNNKREELYSRAQAEGGNQVVLELDRAREEGDVYMDES